MNDPAGQHDRGRATAETPSLPSLLATHGRWLRTVLAARGVELQALDDVFQDVAVAAHRGIGQVRELTKLAPWLYRIAVATALQYRRRTGRRRKFTQRFADSGMAPSELDSHDPLAWLLAKEQQQLVRRAIAALPAKDAEMLLLKYTEDWSYRQLTEHLGVSTSAVEARLHRARGRLRITLAQLAPELAPQR